MKQRVYISNNKDVATQGFLLTEDLDAGSLPVSDTYKDGNTIFIIDVHCIIKGIEKLQNQGGIFIYRCLLKIFEGKQDLLKVIFFSPIPKDDLVKLKPENYVLSLLPFVECKYEENQFDADLNVEIGMREKEGWPQFNNASENLLSGWALYKCQLEENKINENEYVETVLEFDGEISKRKLVIIDDQIEEWRRTYYYIFSKDHKPSLLRYNENGTSTKGFDANKISNFLKTIEDADIIVSDFYLEETHEPNIWMSKEQLETISGYKLFEKIKGTYSQKGINKGACFILHSSSNKIPYYRILEANGIDNWLVKDARPDTTVSEKIENYQTFKNAIEAYTSKDEFGFYKTLKNLWGRIEKLDERAKWWQTDNKYASDEICHILKTAWFVLRTFVKRQNLYMKKSGVVDVHFTPAAIISSIGKLNELFEIDELQKEGNCFQKFLVQTRNAGSHFSDFDQIELIDAFILFDCWLNALNSNSYDEAFKISKAYGDSPFMIQDTSGSEKKRYKYRLLYVYMQFYNSPYSQIQDNARKLIRKRVSALLGKAEKNILLDEIVNHVPRDNYNKVIRNSLRLKEKIAVLNIDTAGPTSNFFIFPDPKNGKRILINFK